MQAPAPRIFISYRTADGADKATALARDLGRVFGDAAVFLDKDDLRGGSRWAQQIGAALSTRPVLLLLVTPQLLTGVDSQGRLQIDNPEDPVRLEVSAALAAGAELIPVLCDGVDGLPQAQDGLPPPFDRLSERTWRRLRAYDWAADLRRLVIDLQALGIEPPAALPRSRRGWLASGLTLLLAVGAGAWWWRTPRGLSGSWRAQLGDDRVRVELQQAGERLTLESHPIDIRERADWADYRSFWRERNGAELVAVRYRGEGRWRQAAGARAEIDLALQLLSVPGDVPVDSGNLSATLNAPDRLEGQRWLNSAQAQQPALLERVR